MATIAASAGAVLYTVCDKTAPQYVREPQQPVQVIITNEMETPLHCTVGNLKFPHSHKAVNTHLLATIAPHTVETFTFEPNRSYLVELYNPPGVFRGSAGIHSMHGNTHTIKMSPDFSSGQHYLRGNNSSRVPIVLAINHLDAGVSMTSKQP